MIEIDDTERSSELGGVAGESAGGVVNEFDCDAGGVRLLKLERDTHFGVGACFPCARVAGHLSLGDALLVLLKRGFRLVGAAECHKCLTE